MFGKNSLFDSLFSSELMRLPPKSVLLEKVPLMALYSRKIGVKDNSQMMWDSFQTKFKCRKLAFHYFWNPSMRTHARVCIHIHAYAELKCAYAYMHMYAYAHPRVSLAFLFQK